MSSSRAEVQKQFLSGLERFDQPTINLGQTPSAKRPPRHPVKDVELLVMIVIVLFCLYQIHSLIAPIISALNFTL